MLQLIEQWWRMIGLQGDPVKQARVGVWATRFGTIAALLCVTAAALILGWQARFYPEVGYDESAAWLGHRIFHDFSFGNDIDPAGGFGFSRGVVMDCYPPVYYVVTGIIFLVAGFGIDQARWASVVFVAATALACYFAARRAGGQGAGWLALAGYLTIPLAVYPVTNRPDVGVPFFLVLSLWSLSEAALTPKRSWLFAAAGFAYALAILSHFVALIVGPVLALALWYAAGLQFWRNKGFWLFVGAWAAPILIYIAILHPYEANTLKSLIAYQNVAGPASSLPDWVLAAFQRHRTAINATPLRWVVIFGLIFPLLVLLARPFLKLDARQAIWLAAAPSFALLISMYPNIPVYGYYGPTYLAPLAVANAIAAASLLKGQRWLLAPIGAALVLANIYLLHQTMEQRIAAVGARPVSAGIAFFDSLGFDPKRPVLADSHWVFASTAASLQNPGALRADTQGVQDFSAELRTLVPRYRPVSEARALLRDRWGEANVIRGLFNQRPNAEINNTVDFAERALFWHPTYFSGAYTVWVPAADFSAKWPQIGVATAHGAQQLFVPTNCQASAPPPSNLQPGQGPFPMRIFDLQTTAPHDSMMLVRVVTTGAPGFVLAFSNRPQASEGISAIRFSRISAALDRTVTHFKLSNGEHGGDLLLQASSLQHGVLVLFAGDADRLVRFELAAPKPAGVVCTSADQSMLASAAASLAGPELARGSLYDNWPAGLNPPTLAVALVALA